jgi:phosphatidate cytidylyltransferase
MRNFLIRLSVAAVGIPALLLIFNQGGLWLNMLVGVLVAAACFEVWQAAQMRAVPVVLWMLGLLALSVALIVWPRGGDMWVIWTTLACLGSAICVVWRRDPLPGALAALTQVTAALWIGVGFGALIALRALPSGQGFQWLMFLFANLWIGDTVAYLAGTWIGGPKLSPRVSPHKTIAGAVAQLIASILIGLVYILAGWIGAPGALLLAAALMIAIVGQIGDLFESTFKRAVGVKDFSALIPGHGGVLDRFDSTLFAAPALWILIRLWTV